MSKEDFGNVLDSHFWDELLQYPIRFNDSCDIVLHTNGDSFVGSNEVSLRSMAMERASWYNLVDYTGATQRKILEDLYPGYVDLPEVLQIALLQKVMAPR